MKPHHRHELMLALWTCANFLSDHWVTNLLTLIPVAFHCFQFGKHWSLQPIYIE